MARACLKPAKFFVCLAFASLGSSTSSASSISGVISVGNVTSGLGLSDFPTQNWNYSLGGNPEPVATCTVSSWVLYVWNQYGFWKRDILGNRR